MGNSNLCVWNERLEEAGTGPRRRGRRCFLERVCIAGLNDLTKVNCVGFVNRSYVRPDILINQSTVAHIMCGIDDISGQLWYAVVSVVRRESRPRLKPIRMSWLIRPILALSRAAATSWMISGSWSRPLGDSGLSPIDCAVEIRVFGLKKPIDNWAIHEKGWPRINVLDGLCSPISTATCDEIIPVSCRPNEVR